MLSLRKSILISACLHVGVFAGFFFISSPGRARIVYKPQYQVRLVQPSEIPALAPKKKTPPPRPAPPPKPKPPPKKEVKLPEKPKPKPPAEKKVKLPEKETPEPVPKKEVKKEEPKPVPPPEPDPEPRQEAVEPEPEAEEALENVLARLRKKAETRKESKAGRSADARSSGWEERQREIRYHEYYDRVERRVRENWIPPKTLDPDLQDVMTVVSITLLPDGRVLKSFIEESSGDPLFDQSVMRAILKSTPLPPPPLGLKQASYELGLRFHSLSHSR